jgi:hypothetical protein
VFNDLLSTAFCIAFPLLFISSFFVSSNFFRLIQLACDRRTGLYSSINMIVYRQPLRNTAARHVAFLLSGFPQFFPDRRPVMLCGSSLFGRPLISYAAFTVKQGASQNLLPL